ncbi:membrane protein [Tetragenococcus halophilus subsp. flandriensis]|uniref:CvpA family protein n=1 Tax=Tetragenococcus halophilus TaxID=51669 RepID=UPI0023E95631|nr:CvpA family protein [Tetragenococcus halophilus]GMA08499.1 membrane protein [Tetragenococcus halophilus subsp. flandriensis]
MILTLLILLILVGGFFIGLRSGLVLQVVGLTGFIIALAVSYLYFDRLSPYLRWIPFPGSSSGNSELFYYQALAFVILFIGIRILWSIIGSSLNFLASLPLLNILNRWLGGAFGVVKVYLAIFLLLNLFAFVPNAFAQQTVSDSTLAQTIVEDTPVLSEKVEEL